jgi:hypothetical protein
MKLRRDPMVAAAELVVTLERLCKEPNKLLTYDEECSCFTEESLAGLVCTVGELNTWPSASNVIPGQVSFLPGLILLGPADELVVRISQLNLAAVPATGELHGGHPRDGRPSEGDDRHELLEAGSPEMRRQTGRLQSRA